MAKRKPSNHRKAAKSTPFHNKPFSPSENGEEIVQIYGQHAVRAALQNRSRRLLSLHATDNAARELQTEIDAARLQPKIVKPGALAAMLPPDIVHQGLLLSCSVPHQPSLEDIAAQGGLLVLLDQVSDPRNVGAIFRAAAFFGAGAIVTTRRHAPPPAGALAKTASGALENLPYVLVANLARALETLAAFDYLTVGLDETGETLIDAVPRDRPLAIIMGAEGKGLRRLTRENCQMLARLPATERQSGRAFTTLNVATATTVTLYALTRPATPISN
ncbi:MAG: TrmH family RNA methyltransferase [Parvibaculales bacterium]